MLRLHSTCGTHPFLFIEPYLVDPNATGQRRVFDFGELVRHVIAASTLRQSLEHL